MAQDKTYILMYKKGGVKFDVNGLLKKKAAAFRSIESLFFMIVCELILEIII